MYKWIITKDYLAETSSCTRSAVGTQGPHGCDARTADELPDSFRLLDGDGEIYYEGKTDCFSKETGFEPLDDFGMPDSGCTDIQYFERGQWRPL